MRTRTALLRSMSTRTPVTEARGEHLAMELIPVPYGRREREPR
jgi:hypothetical protein